MSFSHAITIRYQANGGASFSQAVTRTGGAEVNISESCADNAATVLTFALDVSAMTCCMICSTLRDGVLTINDDGSPDKTINLKAGLPIIWDSLNGQSNPFGTVDVTSAKMTVALGVGDNAGLATVLEIRALVDPTP